MQTAVGKRVISHLSEKIQGEITFEKIHFKPFTTLILKNVLIVDKKPVRDWESGAQVDTFFRSQYIIAKFTIDGLFNQNCLNLDKVFISNTHMNLVLEDNQNPNIDKLGSESLTRIFGIDKSKKREPSEKELFHIKKVEIHNMGFHMFNHREEKIPFRGGINWNDLDVKNININARNLGFKGGVMTGIADKVTFREKSGWAPKSISGEATVGNGLTLIENLQITDKWSDLKLPVFTMRYKNAKEFVDFVSKVKLGATISSSSLDFRTLHFFAPQLEKNRIKARISGKMSGYVNDFEVKDMNIAVKEGGFSGKVNGRITGIPEIEDTRIDARVSNLMMTSKGAGDFLSAWMQEGELNLSKFAKGILFYLNGHAYGPLNNLKANVNLSSLLGRAEASIRADELLNTEAPLQLSGTVSTEDLDIGTIIGSRLIRHTTAEAGFDVKLGRTLAFPDITLDSLSVDHLVLNGYDYSGIKADGHLNSESFDGEVISTDPNLSFIIKADQTKAEDQTQYTMTADIARANLNAMNIDRRGISEVSLSTSADITVSDAKEINGSLEFNNLMLENDGGKYDIGNIVVTSEQIKNDHKLNLTAPFADATFTGSASPKNFVRDFAELSLKKELPAIFTDTAYAWSGDTYMVDIQFHNMMDLLAFVMPGLYIEAGTSLTAQIDDKGEFKTELNSGRLAYKTQYLKGLTAEVNNVNEKLGGEIICNEIQVANLKLNESRLQLFSRNNYIGAGFSYNNDTELENHGHLVVRTKLSRDENGLNFGVDVAPTSIYVNSKEWNILTSKINILGHDISVDSFGLISGDEAITVNGRTSDTQTDTLTVSLQRFDISLINSLVPELGIKGAITGNARLTSSTLKKALDIEMMCDSTYIADTPLGILDIGGRWDTGEKSIDFTMQNNLGGLKNLDAAGKVFLKDRSLDAKVDMNRLRVGYIQPMLTEIFSEMDGYLSGSVMVGGKLDSLEVSSMDCRLDEGSLRVDYTNVPYTAEGTFHLDSKGVYFDNINIKDRFNGTGNVYGSINWNHFRDISFDTNIKVNEIEGINLTERMNNVFYGNIFGTGNISITGPSRSIQMNIDAVTAKTGDIHIPLSDAATSGRGTNLLKFTEGGGDIYIDPYEAMMTDLQRKEAEAAQADFNVNIRVVASPDIEAFVEIDKANGNVLSGRGSGLLDMAITDEVFNINGDYTLTDGNYKFVAMGLVSRDFQIQSGSSVRFNGDLLESTLDIDAIYKTKASLSSLIADTTSVSNRRTVECGISITDKIRDPRLSFSIEIPDLDPTIKSRVESALSTEDKIQKQFLSLVLSNSFLPDEQSGIVNNSSMLYSNVTEMLANQLSNIFQKLDIPLDLGLNYQPNEKGNDIFDVAVSTQLFNNRVLVNGSVGNKQYNSGGTQDVVGDLDIEIKLDRTGSFRLNVFSHSADSYTNFLDNSQRNGVGLTYQTEFNSFGQFVKNIFVSKAKRQAAKQAEEQAIIQGGKIELNIGIPEEPSESDKKKKDGKR